MIKIEEDKNSPFLFGIRHLSPSGAYYLRKLLDKKNPDLVLIEAPSDFTSFLNEIVHPNINPPFAIMAYTKEVPIHTILYPFAVYSPEYQAILWANEQKKECRFIDLPSGVFLALSEQEKKNKDQRIGNSIYEKLDQISGEDGHETFWERTIEHCKEEDSYQKGAEEFGRHLRTLELELEYTQKESVIPFARIENTIRESYMRYQIQIAIQEGFSPDNIVVVTGAYHVEGIRGETDRMTQKEVSLLPKKEVEKTLMPYSYYRLSERSGYGAGNKAPAYYELLWEGLNRQDLSYTSYKYLSSLAAYERANGGIVSSAEVIEAVRLAFSLSQLKGFSYPARKDLRDAAVTCMGHGNFGEIAVAVADTEIGTKIGSLPEGVSQTSIQADFYRILEDLRLEKYKSVTAQDLNLDLREKLRVKSEKAANLDLFRSFFLHRLRVLGISFVSIKQSHQEKATWAEYWTLQWTPEAEIQIVESVLKGETIEQAVSFELKEQIEKSVGISQISNIIQEAFYCGMPESVSYAIRALQTMAVETASLIEIGKTIQTLSLVVQYGDIRRLNQKPLIPLLEQLYLRACLILPENCVCNDSAAKEITIAIESIDEAQRNHEFLEEERWLQVLFSISERDNLNTKLSGFCAALLLERGEMGNESLSKEVQRRLSKGIPADLGAAWFEGLSMKNHYALIARLSLWESLSHYMDSLDDEEFKRALVFLRRAFADFTSKEKSNIAENLGEIWKVNPIAVSEVLNETLTEEASELLKELNDFDFDDI